MKLNNRGFAISTLLYGLMIMSLLIVIALISNLSTNRINTTNFVDKVEDELNRLSLSDTEGDYTGGEVDNNGREYIAPTSGWYKIELWGAAGGGTNGGKGAYTSGIIYLEGNDHLYFYVGEKGNKAATFNGGGSASGSYYAGGGATDVRLISGAWNDTDSLNSRLMVAAGGAGGGPSAGGAGGTLIGGNISQAGTQSTGNKLGVGGNGSTSQSGGGGGYYGGKAANGAGGGSSFIVGYAGVRIPSVTGQVSKTFTYHNGNYNADGTPQMSTYVPAIYNGLMISGVNSDNGKFKVTKVSDNPKNTPPRQGTNQKLNNVRYIRDCITTTNGSNAEWLEIEAIVNEYNADGTIKASNNVAYNKATSTQSVITDGIMDNKDSKYTAPSGSCVTIDLGKIYNLDEIAVWHKYNTSFKNHRLEVSSDNSNYKAIRSISSDTSSTGAKNEEETTNGIRYNTFNIDATGPVPEGDYYLFSANSNNQVLTSYTENNIIFAQMRELTGELDQIWHVTPNGNSYRIENRASGKVIDIGSSNQINLENAQDQKNSQSWTITPLGNGYYTVISYQNTNLSYNTNNGVAEVQSRNSNMTQRWKFVLANY